MCDSNRKNLMSELFNGLNTLSDNDDLCHDVKCCIQKAENKQSANPDFFYVKPQYSSTTGECERKLINKYGNFTTCFLNKNKNLLLECLYTGNYAPLIAIIPKHTTLSLFNDEGVLLFTNSIPTPLLPPVLLSLNSFYSVNLYNFEYSEIDKKSKLFNSEITFAFKLLGKYNVSLPSALSQILLSNIVGVITITDPSLS